ncbi:NAD(P)/FAD-dependent oxidoreductase [Bacillus sp. RAR_GA_16]|uniref:NAD(P)/FAD-dependent oxidoreductase n=1 Tax=Bacillus sp. RAR_GA_16 TaxID=2876774 RepID=UPI001CCE13FD|nr:NAD(P)-binding protein [Bacillus sp. RAR_GA_16]MCA0170677.1 NAD(P)-binding protein [Bacillus sp. RAR_GA_16]
MFDVTIIGAGVSGIFMAYQLTELHPDYKIMLLDKGKRLSERKCKARSKQTCSCDVCDQYIGFGGLGKSEGKFNYTNDFGGNLGRKIGTDRAEELMWEVDRILCTFGGDGAELYHTHSSELKEDAKKAGLDVFTTSVRHLGTKRSRLVFQKIYEYLRDRIELQFETDIYSIEKAEGFNIKTSKGTIQSKKVVVSTGNSGSEWMYSQCEQLGLLPGPARLDLGIRVEMRGNQLESILKNTFETKLHIKRDTYEGTTYCMNPNGRIIRKYQHGFVMPDGQNKREKDLPGNNLNFTLFVPSFYSSKEEADQVTKQVIGGINREEDRIVVQRLKDLKNQQTTTTEILKLNSIVPSLDADAGNLINEVPHIYLHVLLEFFDSLEKLIGEPIDEETLLYGIDGKFYEAKIPTNDHFETEVSGLFLIGDCSGETHSLSQAAASGLYTAQMI